jgi:hypothetical protein
MFFYQCRLKPLSLFIPGGLVDRYRRELRGKSLDCEIFLLKLNKLTDMVNTYFSDLSNL